MRQELLGKQEKTQKSIKRLVDFIKLIQLRKNAPSPPPQSASISCPPQPSSSQSPPLPSTSQKTINLPQSIANNDKTSYLATLTTSTSTHDRASPTSKPKIRCPTPTSCPVAPLSNQKSINHISSSKRSPSRPEGTISLLTVKPKTKTVPQFTTINCRQVAPLPFNPISTPSSTIPCSTIVTSVRSKSSAQSHSTVSPYQNCQILFSPSRTTINWTERPSTAESPGPNSHVANSASTSQQPDLLQKSYCLPTATLKAVVTSSCSTGQSHLDQRRNHEQQRASIVVVSSRQEPAPSSTHCSQAITSPIPSPVVHASHEASAQTIETIRSCDSISARGSTSWCRGSSKTVNQQQSSSSGVPSPSSSST